MSRRILFFICCGAVFTSCSIFRREPSDFTEPQTIVASYYGGTDGFDGRRCANGEIFDSTDLTAAHKTLRFGTLLRLLNPKNGRSVTVRITDRGPYIDGRHLDLSRQAAWELGMIRDGITELIAVERKDLL